jgi:thioredoxin 1
MITKAKKSSKKLIVTAALTGGLLAGLSGQGLAQGCCGGTSTCKTPAVAAAALAPAAPAPVPVPAVTESAKVLPRLLDLGASKCIPCKKMAPILEELKTGYAGRLKVEFIDVWQNPAEARTYGIEMIPTQIFFGADGKELFRHQGFYGKDEMLAKWQELGVELGAATPAAPATPAPAK